MTDQPKTKWPHTIEAITPCKSCGRKIFFFKTALKGISTIVTASNLVGAISRKESDRLDALAEQLSLGLPI